MRIYLVNPSDVAFGVGVITPRWLYVLAAATPAQYGNPVIVDETLESIRPEHIQAGDVVGIGIHTANALRGFEVGRLARDRGAFVVFGGIHATLYPVEAHELGGAHAVVQGDGDIVWATVPTTAVVRRRPGERQPVPAGPLGPAAAGSLYVGVRPDRSWLPQALLVLFCLAN